MTTASNLDAFLGDLPKPVAPKAPTGERLAVFLDGKKWKASYKTPSGFKHVELGTLTGIHTKADAEKRADEIEGRAA